VPEARRLKDLEAKNAKLKKLLAEQLLAIEGLKEIVGKKWRPQAAKRQALEILKSKGLSESAACRFAGVSPHVVNYKLKQPAKDQAMGAQLIETSSRYVRVAYCVSP
jgi:hypothetical protein